MLSLDAGDQFIAGGDLSRRGWERHHHIRMLQQIRSTVDRDVEACEGKGVGHERPAGFANLLANRPELLGRKHERLNRLKAMIAYGYLHEIDAPSEIVSCRLRYFPGREREQARAHVGFPKIIDPLLNLGIYPPAVTKSGAGDGSTSEHACGEGAAHPDDVPTDQDSTAKHLA